jgi:acetyl esterase/lipase
VSVDTNGPVAPLSAASMREVSYLRRQIVTAALTANAIRPSRNPQLSIPTFAAGWLTTELAPHLIALTATDTAVQVARGRGGKTGKALAVASMAGLGYTLYESTKVRNVLEEALVERLGLNYVEQLDAAPTPAELATPWRKLVNPFRMRDDRVTVTRDIPFTQYGARGHLDVYRGVDGAESGAPVLLQVHGGGWTIGRKDQQGIPLMQHLAAKGWVCVSINYRLAPRDAFPAQIVDVKSAIAWIKEHIAEYGGDPGYLAITGGSAGGHLAALAALTPNDPAYQPGFEDADTSVNVAVPHYGVYDMAGVTGLPEAELLRDRFLGPRIFKQRWNDAREVYEAATPILRVTPDAPDFFVIHGRTDTLVPVGHARHFVAKLREESKRSVVYAELPGAQHAFDIFPSIRSAHVVRAVDRYLHWHWNTTTRATNVSEADPADARQ